MNSPSSSRIFKTSNYSREVWILLIIGIALHLIGIHRPLTDAHNTRQCQTAILTKNMMQQDGFPLAAHADWMGDEPGKLFYELPIYNYLVIGVHSLIGDLTISGKLVSIVLWGIAFFLNARLLYRNLSPLQARWGNLLFVVSPLSIFFGQAFQPQMLILVLGLAMVSTFQSFLKRQRWRDYFSFTLLSFLAITIKANEVSHLFLLFGMLLFVKEGWQSVFKFRWWFLVFSLGIVTLIYGEWMTKINSTTFPEWTASGNISKFVGDWRIRFYWFFYAKIAAYLILLLFTPIPFLISAQGFWRLVRKRRPSLYLFWSFSLIFFYLFWGPGAPFSHSYYNLPMLPVACGAFGIGMSVLLARLRLFASKRTSFYKGFHAALLILILCGSVLGSLVLFWPDRAAFEGAAALRRLSQGKEGFVLCYANHTHYGPGYTHYATLFYYSGLRGWNENPRWSNEQRDRILKKCRWVIELKYVPEYQFPGREYTWFSNRPRNLLDTRPVETNPSFILRESTRAYRIWEWTGP